MSLGYVRLQFAAEKNVHIYNIEKTLESFFFFFFFFLFYFSVIPC